MTEGCVAPDFFSAMPPLARKYRPLTFSQIVGQEVVVRTLKNALLLKRLHPVYIFTGTRGVGKTTTARILAKALNCQQGPTPEPCLTCSSCHEISEGRSLDVLEIDAASHTRVEETREILEQVPYAPARGSYRVFIIDEAHMLSRSSFNALLKTLEEPPPHVLFILATTEPEKIPETVRSRAQEFPFYPVPSQLISQEISRILTAEGISYEAEAVRRLGERARGSLRDALSLCDQVLTLGGGKLSLADVELALGLTSQEEVQGVLGALLRFDPTNLYERLTYLRKEGKLGEEFMYDLFSLLHERIEEAARRGSMAIVDDTGEEVRIEDLCRLAEGVHRIILEVRRSPMPELYLMVGLLKLAMLKPIGNLEVLIQNLFNQHPPSSLQDNPTLSLKTWAKETIPPKEGGKASQLSVQGTSSYAPAESSLKETENSSTKDPPWIKTSNSQGEEKQVDLYAFLHQRFPTLAPAFKKVVHRPPDLEIHCEEGIMAERIEARVFEITTALKDILPEPVQIRCIVHPPASRLEPVSYPLSVERLLKIFPGSEVEVKPLSS